MLRSNKRSNTDDKFYIERTRAVNNLTNTVHKLHNRNVSVGLNYKTELSNHPLRFMHG